MFPNYDGKYQKGTNIKDPQKRFMLYVWRQPSDPERLQSTRLDGLQDV